MDDAPCRSRRSRLAARVHAERNLPSVILEWRDTPEGAAYVAIARFDWQWDEARGMPVVGVC